MSMPENKDTKARAEEGKKPDLETQAADLAEGLKAGADELAKLQKHVKEQDDKFLRLFAEFENYKKRTTKERLALFKSAGQDIITALLPVLDDFQRADKEIAKSGDKDLLKGVVLIHSKLKEILQAKGLKPMSVNTGDAFDTDLHEAITQIPAPDKELSGKIIEVIELGYFLNDKVIRFAKVVVGQ